MAKRILLLLILLLSYHARCLAQKPASPAGRQGQSLIDSLLAELPKAKEDTNKVKLLADISHRYWGSDPDEGIQYGLQAHVLAEKLHWKAGAAKALNSLGNNYLSKADYTKALDHYFKALKIHEDLGNKDGIASVTGNVGNVYYSQSHYSKALAYFFKSLTLNEALGDKKGMAGNHGGIGNAYFRLRNYPKALEYHFKALKTNEDIPNRQGIAVNLSNIGSVYREQGDYQKASQYFFSSLKMHEDVGNKRGIAVATGNIGSVFSDQKNYTEAAKYYSKAMQIAEEIGGKNLVAMNVLNIGCAYLGMATDTVKNTEGYRRISTINSNYLQNSIPFLKKAADLHKELGDLDALQETYENLAKAYQLSGSYKLALEAHQQHMLYKDSVFNKESTEKIAKLEMQREFDRMEDSMKFQQQLTEEKLKVAKLNASRNLGINFGLGGALLGFVFVSWAFHKQNKKRERINNELTKEKKKSDDLLLNILPSEVAEELKASGNAEAKQFDNVSVLFTDFVGFTHAGEKMNAKELVAELHTCFKTFDEIASKYNIEKIKTIGDAYLAVCGLPLPDDAHAENVIKAALEIKEFMSIRKQELGDKTFKIRIGIHSGPVVAGIVGVKKFAYDIWGDTVNTAARMEQNSEAGKINISETTYELIKDGFECSYRGEITAKNKGDMRMYFVERKKVPELV